MAIAIDFEGRVILVCGVARGGIGGATARRIAAAGATVFAVDYKQVLIDETVADIEAAGGKCVGFLADLTDPAQSDTIVPEVVRRFGRLDGVANVAGGLEEHEWRKLEETPLEVYRHVVNINLEYVFRICRDAAAYLIKEGRPGSLVNVGSISLLTAAPFHGPYGAAKAGIAALTRTMAIEWKPHGIRANTVSPGAVPSEANTSKPSWGSSPTTTGPTSNLTSVDELANGILFLLSDLASGVSGQNLVVDSALSANFCAGSAEQMSRSVYKGG